MEKKVSKERTTKGILTIFNLKSLFLIFIFLDGLKISNSQVKRLERELKNLKEEVRILNNFLEPSFNSYL